MAASNAAVLAPLGGFYAAAERALPVVETVGSADAPGALRELLSAARPLTPRLEDHHGAALALRVLERRRYGVKRSSMRGKGMVSRTWCRPQSQATMRSMPMPKPACGTEP